MRSLGAEDEASLRGSIATSLRARGHQVDLAGACEDLESMLVPDVYGAAILDRLLPDGDSLEVLQRCRAGGLNTPVLFLSALDAISERVDGLQTGAADYLTKPFAMAELVARVEAIGRRRSMPQPAVLRVGQLEVSAGRREVRRAGVLLPLRPKEFDLLLLLVAQPLRVVAHEEILEACWEAGATPRSNVEEVLVASLRRKLGKPNLIRTVRGTGYAIDEDACHVAP